MVTPNLRRRLCRARGRLRETHDPAWSITQIAREAGFSAFHFIRLFAAVFGETPHQFRQRHRLELAKQMLAAGTGSVTDVCMSVGFSSLGSFSYLFRSRFGESPRSYRRRLVSSAAAPEDVHGQLQPGCISLLARAWQDGPQFSRSSRGEGLRQSPQKSIDGDSPCAYD